MINLIKKENLSLSILQTDFNIYADIIETFLSDDIKKASLIDLDNYIVPEYFNDKITLVIQTNGMLAGYALFEFKNKNNVSQVEIDKLYVKSEFKEKLMEDLLIEAIIYIAGEVGSRSVVVTIDEHDSTLLKLYRNLGFYEVGMNEDGTMLSINVISAVSMKKLNDKFRSILPGAVDYKSLKLVKKITDGSSSNIYLTGDNQILKLFTTSSFTYIKDKEETLKILKEIKVKEVIKPKKLVYYDGMFIGYIMEYLPEGKPLREFLDCSFEEKIDKIKEIEKVIKKLHDEKIYICDLNLDNIFVDEKNNIKLIDCDSFVVKENVMNAAISNKYKDPINKIVSEKTDLYAFAILALELLTNVTIPKDASLNDIEKVYNKNKSKLPISFKEYFDIIFKTNERIYLSESYEKYLNELYKQDEETDTNNKSGNISIIILSFILVTIAFFGYLFFKYSR